MKYETAILIYISNLIKETKNKKNASWWIRLFSHFILFFLILCVNIHVNNKEKITILVVC